MFQVHQHRQLLARNGDLVAGGGEKVAADHPAVLAIGDPGSIGRFVDVDMPKIDVSRPVSVNVREPVFERLPAKDVDED